MKKCRKRLLISGIICALTLSVTGFCASGDIAGHIYSTDILAYVNGKPIEAYNIGGRTMIIAEDLESYGFNHWYNDEERKLVLESNFNSDAHKQIAEIPRGRVGEILGDIYETDISVFYNDIPIVGCNIGGRTAICIEDMGEAAGSPHEEYGYSKYLANYVWDAENRTISLNSYINNYHEIMGEKITRLMYTFSDNVFYAYPNDDETYAWIVPSIEGIPSEDEGASSMYYSDEFKDKKYTLAPLYLEVNGVREEVGTCVSVLNASDPDYIRDSFIAHIDNPEAAAELAKTARTPLKTYEEAMEYLEDKYTIEDKVEDGEYTIIKAVDENKNVFTYVVKRSGGMLCAGRHGNHYDSVEIVYDEHLKCYTVDVYPFADSHGHPVTMSSPILVDEYVFD